MTRVIEWSVTIAVIMLFVFFNYSQRHVRQLGRCYDISDQYGAEAFGECMEGIK